MRSKLFLPLLGVMTIILFSCQKDVIPKENDQQLVSKVNSWLDSRKPDQKPTQAENVELLKNNLQFSNLRIENSAEGEKIIIIPVQENFKTLKHIDKASIPNLVLMLDNRGDIRKGNLVLFYPQNGKMSKVPDNTFYNIMNTAKPECNGKFKYLTVTGKRCYELEYENGHLKSVGDLKKSAQNNTTRTNFCVDWVWHYSFYDEFGMVYYQYDEYIGTTCQGEDCYDPYDAMLCPMDASSGGGTGDDQAYEYAVSKPWKFLIDQVFNNDNSLLWQALNYENLSGVKKASETCGGHFTNIAHVNSYLTVGNGYTWTELGSTVSLNNPCQVQSWITGKVTKDSNSQFSTHSKTANTSFNDQF